MYGWKIEDDGEPYLELELSPQMIVKKIKATYYTQDFFRAP